MKTLTCYPEHNVGKRRIVSPPMRTKKIITTNEYQTAFAEYIIKACGLAVLSVENYNGKACITVER